MQKTFIVLVSLLGLLSASQSFASSSLLRSAHLTDVPLTNLPWTNQLEPNTLQFNLTDDATGFVGYVDFGKNIAERNIERDQNRPMSVALYSSDTLLVQTQCFNFKKYLCNQYADLCNKVEGEPKTVNYLHYVATGPAVTTELYTSVAGWSVTKKSSVVQAAACEGEAVEASNSKAYGVLGLGYAGTNKESFVDNTYFTLHFNFRKNPTRSFIQFKERDYTSSSYKERFRYATDANWHSKEEFKANFGPTPLDKSYKAIVDINSDKIGVPADLFANIIANMNTYVRCNDAKIAPECTGDFSKVPEFVLQNTAGGKVVIQPIDLIKDYSPSDDKGKTKTCKLNLKVVGNGLAGESAVTVAYQNTIVLGYPAFSQYYTKFDHDKGLIIAYENTALEEAGKAIGGFLSGILTKLIWGAVIMGIVICLLIVACCGGCACLVSKAAAPAPTYYQAPSNDPFVRQPPAHYQAAH